MGAVVGKIAEETPAHVVLRRADGYEVWRYPRSIVAVVRAASLNADNPPKGSEFTGQAFRILARYIGVFGAPENRGVGDGDSEQSQKLAMTAPVIMPAPQKLAMTAPVIMPNSQQDAREGTDCMMFVLPSHIKTVQEAPRPTNSAVTIEELSPNRCEAVLAFSGDASMKSYANKAEQLLSMLQRDGVAVTGDWTAQGYNPPFTLPWLRRNEVHVPVDGEPFADITGEPKRAD